MVYRIYYTDIPHHLFVEFGLLMVYSMVYDGSCTLVMV